MPATQDNRPIRIDTPLGKDAILLKELTVEEELGRPFLITANLRSEGPEPVDPTRLVNQSVTITINLKDGNKRYFNGIVSRFSMIGTKDSYEFWKYSIEIVPAFALLRHTTDCRLFIQKSNTEIVMQLLKEHDIKYDDDSLHDFDITYEPRELAVQYRKSTFDFISRLLENEGVYYHFKHSEEDHVMEFNDTSPSDHHLFSETANAIPYITDINHDEAIHAWEVVTCVGSNTSALSDYDYTKPKVNLLTSELAPPSKFSLFDAPGLYYAADSDPIEYGAYYAKIRLEEQVCRQRLYKGSGPLLNLGVGYIFKPLGTYKDEECLTIRMILKLETPEWTSTESNDIGMSVVCDFEAIPKDVYFRPARITPKPLVSGVLSAVVVGPEGQDPMLPYTNELGCVKVQFHWDRYGNKDENSSTWIRVGQFAAGKNWGSMFIPRIGDEVLVAFEAGNPNRPYVITSLYNALNTPSMPLPEQSQVSYFVDDGGNGIWFKPVQGNECIKLFSTYENTTRIMGDISSM